MLLVIFAQSLQVLKRHRVLGAAVRRMSEARLWARSDAHGCLRGLTLKQQLLGHDRRGCRSKTFRWRYDVLGDVDEPDEKAGRHTSLFDS